MQLIYGFVFAYAKSRFSHGEALADLHFSEEEIKCVFDIR